MRIKRLEICGFKSFVDRTVLHFDEEIVGIVGPNGCGKSNVVDAIRWVMGEQSAKHLRGKSMEDVIFNGSEQRAPLGFAEVALTFDNTQGTAPEDYKDYDEITVMRRLDRAGESDYFINKVPVRLMDVTNIFLGTGIGTKAYSIIEQGRVGQIVSAKPKDRRHFIEEAAGVTKFNARRRAAERKMDYTRQNLLRVKDVVAELERNLASLKRQAQKAERYKRYKDELRDLELHAAAHRWLELTAKEKAVASTLTEAQEQLHTVREELREREEGLQEKRVALDALNAHVEDLQKKTFESENAVHLLESQVAHHLDALSGLREREEQLDAELDKVGIRSESLQKEHEQLQLRLREAQHAEREAQGQYESISNDLEHKRGLLTEAEQSVEKARDDLSRLRSEQSEAQSKKEASEARKQELNVRLQRLAAESQELEQGISEDEGSLEELASRLEGLRGGRSEKAERKEELRVELEALRERVKGTERNVDEVRAQVVEKKSRLTSLEEIWRQFEGFDAGTRSVMTHFGPHQDAPNSVGSVQGMLADRIDCPEELTQALAAALGQVLRCILVPDLEDSKTLIAYLNEGHHGRATFVGTNDDRLVQRPKLPQSDGVLGHLLDRIEVAQSDRALVERFLGNVVLVQDLPHALALHKQHPETDFVTLAGEFLSSQGLLTGGGEEEKSTHVLEVKREVRTLREALDVAQTELSAAEQLHTTTRKRLAELQAASEAAQSEAHDTELAMVEAQAKQRQAQHALETKKRRLEALGEERNEVRLSVESLHDQIHDFQARSESLSSQLQAAEQKIQAALQVFSDRKFHEEQQAKRVTEQRVAVAELRQKTQAEAEAIARIAQNIEELRERECVLRAELEEGKLKQEEMTERVRQSREKLAERKAQSHEAQQALEQIKTAHENARAQLSEMELALRDVRSRIDEETSSANELSIQRREAVLGIEHLLEHVFEKHRLDVRSVITDYHDRQAPSDEQRARVEELNHLIGRMGEVNLLAIEEFEEKNERYEFLQHQQSDLESALDQLDKAIRKMNKESRRLFKEAFEAINVRFQRVFPAMFGGGKGELLLTEPQDMLETGVDIVARPPGKRISSIDLMSGGEKALTAVALIFSIFQHKPSPFCLLDEVDAPLDEANIDRFNEAIRSMAKQSQFILITHSRRTMELTDRLYGVTMEAPGISKVVTVQVRRGEEEKKAPAIEAQAHAPN